MSYLLSICDDYVYHIYKYLRETSNFLNSLKNPKKSYLRIIIAS
jgi:hypothetical protein